MAAPPCQSVRALRPSAMDAALPSPFARPPQEASDSTPIDNPALGETRANGSVAVLAVRPTLPSLVPCSWTPGLALIPLLPCHCLGFLMLSGPLLSVPHGCAWGHRRLAIVLPPLPGTHLHSGSTRRCNALPNAGTGASGTLGPGCFMPGHSTRGCPAAPCAGPGPLLWDASPPSGRSRAGSHRPRPVCNLAAPGRSQGVPQAADYQ